MTATRIVSRSIMLATTSSERGTITTLAPTSWAAFHLDHNSKTIIQQEGIEIGK